MRDPARIDVVIEKLRDIWKRNPDMRLGQMVANVTTEDDIYHMEDSELIDRIEKVHCP